MSRIFAVLVGDVLDPVSLDRALAGNDVATLIFGGLPRAIGRRVVEDAHVIGPEQRSRCDRF